MKVEKRESSLDLCSSLVIQNQSSDDLKVQTEATICAAQEQALRTNYIKNKTDKASENP